MLGRWRRRSWPGSPSLVVGCHWRDLPTERKAAFGLAWIHRGNAHLKVPALVAGMVAGAGSIDDMDLLRHGGMGRLFGPVRALSTLGAFLRTFTFGHVRQLDGVATTMLAQLASGPPRMLGPVARTALG